MIFQDFIRGIPYLTAILAMTDTYIASAAVL